MSRRFRFIASLMALAFVALLVLAITAWNTMQERIDANSRLKANIAEMARIDEVLTTSALLAAATGDASYAQRYKAHVGPLEQLLDDTIAMFASDKAAFMLRKTDQANQWLVRVEMNALEAARSGPDERAYRSLRSDAYTAQKRVYAEGLQQTMQFLTELAKAKVTSMLWFVTTLVAMIIGAMICFLKVLHEMRSEHRALREKQVQMRKMRGLLSTFMDLQNNLLNNMVYFRTKAACHLDFDEGDIRIIDQEIEQAKSKLSELTTTGIGTTRDLGGIFVIEPESGEKKAA